MDNLDAIGRKHGTDKASTGHNYLAFYEEYLRNRRDLPIKILEIGVLNGASLATWRDYFPHASIVGADINPAAKRFERDRVKIELLDQSNVEELTRLAVKHGPFDLVIEDGSHLWEHQITTLRVMFPFVAPDGLYILEDLQTNYGSLEKSYRGIASGSCMDYLKRWVDLLVGDALLDLAEVEDAFLRTYGRAAHHITFRRHCCVIGKNVPAQIERKVPGPGQPVLPSEGAPAFTVGLLALVAGRREVFGDSGYVNLGDQRYKIMGLVIEADDDPLAIRTRSGEGDWTPWMERRNYRSLRGGKGPLTGVAVRANAPGAAWQVRVAGKFEDVPDPVIVGDGEECSAGGKALLGIQIDLIPAGGPDRSG